MPENAWQESRDTGLRHLSVGVALYAGLCSGFMLLYAPAFLSLLSLFERKEGIMRICVKRHKARIRSLTLYWLMLWLYVALCPCFSKLAWQALASTPGAACDLLGEAAAPQAGSRQHKATHKLA